VNTVHLVIVAWELRFFYREKTVVGKITTYSNLELKILLLSVLLLFDKRIPERMSVRERAENLSLHHLHHCHILHLPGLKYLKPSHPRPRSTSLNYLSYHTVNFAFPPDLMQNL